MKINLPSSETALFERLNRVFSSGFTAYLKSTYIHREELGLNRRYATYAVFFISAIMVALFLVSQTQTGIALHIMVASLLLWSLVLLLSARKWLHNSHMLEKEMNMALAPIFTNALDVPILYTHNQKHRAESQKFLSESGLFDINDFEIVSDDVYMAYTDAIISFRDLKISRRSPAKTGKFRSVINVFDGMFIAAMLPTPLANSLYGRVGSVDSVPKSVIWQSIERREDLKEQKVIVPSQSGLEIKIFSSEIEKVGDLITPQVIEVLLSWKSSTTNNNMCFSVVGNRLFLLIPDEHLLAGGHVTSARQAKVKSLAQHIIVPLWRGLRFVDSVSRRNL